MADTRVSGDISAAVMRNQFDCKQTGFLSKEGKGMLGWIKCKWSLKYFIISKGAQEGCVWNLNCFDNDSAGKQEWSISMREVESIMEYNKGIEGIRIIFIDHKTPDLILKCDSGQNRKTWLQSFKQAHNESQPFSADSGYGSGGSVPSSNWEESERASTVESSVFDYSYADQALAAQTKKHGRDNNEPSCSNEVGPNPLYVYAGKDDALRRPAAKSPNEKDQNRNKVKVGNNKDYKRSAKDKDTTVTEECDRNTDITCVKESLPSSVQETKSGNGRSESMATTVHNQHKINSTKPNIQARSDRLTSPSNSDIYESFELGASEGDKKSNNAMIQELTKSFQGSKHPENKVPLRKHTYLPQCQKYPLNPLSKFGKKDRVPPSSVQSIKDEGAESSNGICKKHDESNTAETSVLPKDNGDIHFHQASTSYSKQNKSADTTKTEKAPHILKFDIRIDDEGINTYENIKFFENKEQKIKVSVNENETKRGSNSSTDSTSSSDSSTDSVTYESPDEGAHDENRIILREEEYLCEREEDVKRNLEHNPSGTFLICISGSVQKLWFVTGDGRRYFIIQRQGEKLSLYKNCSKPENMFDNLKQLLYFYHLNDLPSKSYKLKLKRAYKSAKRM